MHDEQKKRDRREDFDALGRSQRYIRKKTAQGGKGVDKMYLGVVDKVETTTDKNVANALLDKGWVLLEVVVTFKKEFLFLLAACDENRTPISGVAKSRN